LITCGEPVVGGCSGVRDPRWSAQDVVVELQRSMPPLRVVSRGVRGEDPAEVSFAEDQHPVGKFGPDGPHEAFVKQFGLGQRGGIWILTTSVLASASTASNDAAN
jgi:hypothetical protein